MSLDPHLERDRARAAVVAGHLDRRVCPGQVGGDGLAQRRVRADDERGELTAGGELVTVIAGSDTDLADAVCAHLAGVHPTVEVTRYDGAPEGVRLQVGVE